MVSDGRDNTEDGLLTPPLLKKTLTEIAAKGGAVVAGTGTEGPVAREPCAPWHRAARACARKAIAAAGLNTVSLRVAAGHPEHCGENKGACGAHSRWSPPAACSLLACANTAGAGSRACVCRGYVVWVPVWVSSLLSAVCGVCAWVWVWVRVGVWIRWPR